MRDGSRLIVGGQIILHGYVGGDLYDDEAFSAAEVIGALAQFQGRAVTVRVNSVGGDAYEGAAIRAALAAHDGAVLVIVEGAALSAASLICCGAGRVEVAADASVMVHDPRNIVMGDPAAMSAEAARLDALAQVFAPIYAARLGVSAEAARVMMRAETWWRGAEAVAVGFADGLAEGAPPQEVAAMRAAAPVMLGEAGDRLSDVVRAAAIAAGWIEGGRGSDAEKMKGRTMPENIIPAPLDDAAASAALLAADAAAAAARGAPGAPGAPSMSAADAARFASDAVALEGRRVSEIHTQGRAFSVSAAACARMVADGVALDAIPAAMAAAWMAEGVPAMPGHRAPAEPRGGRMDAGDTVRNAMGDALLARMSGGAAAGAVQGAAREWMGATMAEMAGALSGHRGVMRTYAQRSEVLMAGLHTGSDFVGIVSGAMNRRLSAVYDAAIPTYRTISEEITFADFRPQEVISVGDLPDLAAVGSSGEIKFGSLGDGRETAVLIPYAVKLGIARDVFVNDDLGALSRVLSNYGRRVAMFEEVTFWKLALAAKLSDGVAIWHADRGNLGAAALTVDALSVGRAAIRKTPGVDGKPMNAAARFLIVGPDLETDAEKLTTAIAAVVAGEVNPFAARLTLLVSGEIAGDDWILSADPGLAPAFGYGFLEGAAAPQIRVETPFGQSGLGVSVEHDFGFGALSANTYRSTGA
jgi:ATP-dependent protease ClpP protease subunit